jgi:glycosyltransferase involved in cell wall biosynthesis
MATAMGSITRAAARKRGDRLNILTYPCHERWQSGLKNVNATFYMIQASNVKTWNPIYAPLPDNHVLLNPSRENKQIPADIDFDLIFSQNKFSHFQISSPIAKSLHLPHVCVDHTQPLPEWPKAHLEHCRKMRGDINVFISEFSCEAWGWDKNDPSVRIIHHGVDTETFSPNELMCERKPAVLSVVNDWINRDVFCGFKLWQQVSAGLPTVVVGDTPGLSSPAKSVHDLVMKYRSNRVFLNTSLVSPIPTVLLEAMACGCAVVSTATSMIPEVIQDGVNGFLSNDPKVLHARCQELLKDERLAKRLGEEARKTILSKFSMANFVSNWDSVFKEASEKPYLGDK